MRITKNKDLYDIIELAGYGLPSLRNRHDFLLNQVTALQRKKVALGTEILGLRNSICTNNEIISRQNTQLRTLDRKLSQLQIMLRDTSKGSNYSKITEIVDRRLNDKRSLLVAALFSCF